MLIIAAFCVAVNGLVANGLSQFAPGRREKGCQGTVLTFTVKNHAAGHWIGKDAHRAVDHHHHASLGEGPAPVPWLCLERVAPIDHVVIRAAKARTASDKDVFREAVKRRGCNVVPQIQLSMTDSYGLRGA